MATTWMRAAMASSSSVLLRASRPGRVLPKRAFLSTSSVRLAAAAPAQQPKLDQEYDAEHKPQVPQDDSASTVGVDQPRFDTLVGNVSKATLKAIESVFRITHMSPVQAAVLPLLPGLAEPYRPDGPARDLLVKAKTGTGKTLGFLIPAVEARLKALDLAGKKAVQDAGLVNDKHIAERAIRNMARNDAGCLIISPTRELATQIANEALRLSSKHEGFEVRLFVGGASKRMQMRDWMRGRRDIVVGTPGRIRDLLESEPEITKGMEKCKMLILDEADTLLEMGFREEIQAISRFLAPTPERQTFLFSATVSREIQQIARATLDKNHLFIDCVPVDASPVHAHVPQYHTILPTAAHQLPHILKLLAHDQLIHPGNSKTIIFLPTTRLTQLFSTLIQNLKDTCLPAGRATRTYEIHSKRTMESRTKTSNLFRADKGDSILISSDVSARGVDYPGVTRVIQVGIPSSTDQYVHRVGRTGRGREAVGRADLVLLPWELGFVTWQLTDIPLKPLTVTELDTQIKDLAAQNRESFVSVAPEIEKEISTLLSKVDPDAIKETLASLLGYYVSKGAELRCQKSVMVEGLKQWTVEAMGLPNPPYVSDSFLERLGISDNRTKHFGSARIDRRMDTDKPAWAHRGNVRGNTSRMEQERFKDRRTGGFGSGAGRSSGFGDRERPSFGGNRERPSFGGDRERSSFGGDRERRPSYGGNRDRPSFGGNRERPRPSFGGPGERPSWADRNFRGDDS